MQYLSRSPKAICVSPFSTSASLEPLQAPSSVESNGDVATDPGSQVYLGLKVQFDSEKQCGVFQVAVLVDWSLDDVTWVESVYRAQSPKEHFLTSLLTEIARCWDCDLSASTGCLAIIAFCHISIVTSGPSSSGTRICQYPCQSRA